ncbi:MAG: nucleotidyltransferase [Acidobacteria bacterium]|nr:nucleotidyltransferase [Acidobacteriota bacterium]
MSALSRVLEEWSARWYVFGAQAVLIWGRPRLTADVDVTIRLVPEDTTRFVNVMESAGFRLRVAAGPAFVQHTRVLPFAHTPTGLPLDLVLAGPGLEEVFLSRAVTVDLGGVSVPVISPEDLIVTKVLAGRTKDLEDVRGVLLERLDTLDLAMIRDTLGLLEDALSQSDLRRAFDAELARVRTQP